jgi:hypothetical protein
MNAKEEFIQSIQSMGEIKCASISYGDYLEEGNCKELHLPVGHSKAEYTAFLEGLDFNYDSGFGSQELFGTVWFKDGDWAIRGEYDGSEWWECLSLPNIPDTLL